MTLSEFMAEQGLADAEMAVLIGDCSDHAVKKWRYGERLPRGDQMRRIYAVTDGAVTPNDFVLHSDTPAAPAAAGFAAT